MIGWLTNWLDGQGDLLSITNRLVSFGPALVVASVATLVWAQVSQGLIFFLVMAVGLAANATYYAAFFRALVRQRERRYKRDVKPILSSEYKNG